MIDSVHNLPPQDSGFGAAILSQGWACALIAITGGALLGDIPEVNWWWCWCWGVALLVMSVSGGFFQLPDDLPRNEQTMRPWLLVNLIFCGYSFLTSIFFWLDLQGYHFFELRTEKIPDPIELKLASQSQFYYLVGQVGFLLGLGMIVNWRPTGRYQFVFRRSVTETLLWTAAIAILLMFALPYVPGLNQFAVRGKGVCTVAAGISLGIAYRTRSSLFTLALIANLALGGLALSSGWKEEVLVLVILNAITFFPAYPKSTSVVTLGVMVIGFVLLPPLANQIRQQSWQGGADRFDALQSAIETVQGQTSEQLADGSWEFLTGRLSEIGLFNRYQRSVPSGRPYYGTQIVEQAALTPIPRIFWPSKENTESMVHRRVVENGAVSELSNVSAKPQFVVDGYLSYGGVGVFISLFAFGMATQWSYQLCETWMGGYLMGGVLFNGLFSFFWRGACFEFLSNSFFWSLVMVAVLHSAGVAAGVIRPVKNDEIGSGSQ